MMRHALTAVLVVCSVLVSAQTPFAIVPASTTISVGQAIQLQTVRAKGNVRWSSGAQTIATVSNAGLVTGRAPGIATITAKSSNMTANAVVQVIVTNPPVPVTVTITSPTSNPTHDAGEDATVALAGTASSLRGISGPCTWTNSLGGSGLTTGSLTWSVTVSLTVGDNVITITCLESGGGKGSDVITVTRDSGGGGGGGIPVTCTTTLNNPTASAIQTAVNNAADGDVICVTGSVNVNSGINFSMSKAVTLAGSAAMDGGGTTTLTGTSIIGMNGTCTGTSTKVYRIAGFTFSGGANRIWFNAFNTPPCTLTNIRIDHNTFDGQTADQRILQFGDNSNNSFFYGVIDHNTVTNTTGVVFLEYFASTGATAPAATRGTATNMFVEDNEFTITANGSLTPCMDSTGSPSIVWRFNTHTNCRLATHGTTHGGGMVSWEVYGNDLTCSHTNTDCFRTIHHQGSGESIVFGNILRPSAALGEDAINWLFYRSASPSEATYSAGLGQCDGSTGTDGNRQPDSTYFGYPCKRQPGRDVNAVLHPMYFWDNRTGAGTRVPFACVDHPNGTPPPATCTHHIVTNRDVFDAVSANAQTSSSSPFNGTTGMGFGTLANRPTTCSVAGTDAGDAGNGGVGYFATDQGSWNSSSSNPKGVNVNGADGLLYRCSSTNTWTLHYTPYTYPHPLTQ